MHISIKRFLRLRNVFMGILQTSAAS